MVLVTTVERRVIESRTAPILARSFAATATRRVILEESALSLAITPVFNAPTVRRWDTPRFAARLL